MRWAGHHRADSAPASDRTTASFRRRRGNVALGVHDAGAVSGVQRHLQPTAGGDCLRSTSSVGHSSSSFAPEDAANGTGDQATSTTIILRSTRVGVQKSERGLCDTTNPGVFVFIKPHCLFLRELGWRTPPLCGRPFSTLRAPSARRILCALRHTKYCYGRPGPAGLLPLPV